MIAEQLQAARAAHWRQNQSPLLTLADAENWLGQHPLCLYLPRNAQLPAPAPSFVEACQGSRQATPGIAAIEHASGLLTRLVEAGTVVPLNLLGTVTEQPDYLAHRDALPFVLSLRADPNWKQAPQKSSGHKVSPLVLELWKVLDQKEALTAEQARAELGRELTEAAVLRAVCELWQTLRVSPVYGAAGQPALWEMMRVRHRAALTTAGATSQVTSISLLVSMYLQSVYAASGEEIEVFLSPVASRSRVREAVRGLSATRQIQSLSMDAQTYFFLENGLPAFAELAAPAEPGGSADALAKPPAMANTQRKPVPRKMQATRPPGAVPASAPIFRRPLPAVPPPLAEAARAARTGPGPERPAASTGWKGPAKRASAGRPPRSGAPTRSSGKPGGPSQARKTGWADTSGRPAATGRPRPAARMDARPGSPPASRPGSRPGSPPASRPAFPPARDVYSADRPARSSAGRPATNRPDNQKPWSRRPASRPERPQRPAASYGARPPRNFSRPEPGAGAANVPPAFKGPRPPQAGRPARGGSRPGAAPGKWTGARSRETPKPWALPGRQYASGSRQPRPAGQNTSPRPARDPRKPSFGPPGGRSAGSREAASAGRPPARPYNRPPRAAGADFRRDSGRLDGSSRPAAPAGGRAPRSGAGSSSDRPRPETRPRPRPDARPRPSPRRDARPGPRTDTRPGPRPGARAGYVRPGTPPRTASGPRQNSRGGSDRPKPYFKKSSAPPSRSSKPGARFAAKAGKPAARSGPKPDRKKPEA